MPHILLTIHKKSGELSGPGGSADSLSPRAITDLLAAGLTSPPLQQYLVAELDREVDEEAQGVYKSSSGATAPSWREKEDTSPPPSPPPPPLYRCRQSTPRGPMYRSSYVGKDKVRRNLQSGYLTTNVSDSALSYAKQQCLLQGLLQPTFTDLQAVLTADVKERNRQLVEQGLKAEVSGAVFMRLDVLLALAALDPATAAALGGPRLWEDFRNYINEVPHFRKHLELARRLAMKEWRAPSPTTPSRSPLRGGSRFSMLSEEDDSENGAGSMGEEEEEA